MPQLALTIPEAVAASRLSRSALYDALKNGQLKASKAGRRTIILTSELERFLTELPPYQAAA